MADDSSAASSPFAIVPDHVSDAGQYVQRTAQTLVNGVRSADADVQGLMTSWKGTAANAYAAGWEETRDGALQVLEALNTMAELLGVAAVEYTSTDTTNTTALRQSSLDLP
ncbi:WXG100 family type VII secretion target [Nocardia arizonensis]|uniref:WXG100 family type VII secretion target n=1 Tax=Nocardia arizonensis TaxID=1141647 RepID=UPI0009E94C11|nr:WXG100 family type VII secretion target [Nocardia arizonensis]